MRVLCVVGILGILGAWCAAPPLSAQQLERRPTGALFAAEDPRLAADPPDARLGVMGSLFGAYDDGLLVGPGMGTMFQPSPRSRRSYVGLGGGVAYDRPGDQSLRASFTSTARYHPDDNRLAPGRQEANLLSSSVMELWSGARLRSSGMARYSRFGTPFATIGFVASSFPADMFDGDDEIRLRRTDLLRGQAQVEQDWGPRKSIALIVGVQSSGLEGSDRAEGYELGGTFSNELTRYGTLRVGYTHQEVGYGAATYLVRHLNIGGNYARPISASRRAYVSFSGGSAVLEADGQARLQATGDAAFQYEFGRSWRGSAHYRRGFMFLDEITGPLVSDGVVAELAGLFSRRLELEGSGSFTHGTAGVARSANPYDVYSARTQVRYALSRVTAIYAEYLFYKYQFAESVRLGGSLPSRFDRHTIRAGVTIAGQLLR